MISTALIHTFSPEIESQAAKKFVDPRHENKFFALTPAFKWHEGSLVFACKIWLKMVRFDNSFMPRPLNEFGDHHTYMQTFDKHLKPTSTAHLLGIHLRIQPGHYGNGPLDVRMYRVQNQLFLTIHGSYLAASGDYYDTQMIYDVREDLVYLPEIEGGSPAINRVVDPSDPVLRDKNWMPLIQDDQLYFVHKTIPEQFYNRNMWNMRWEYALTYESIYMRIWCIGHYRIIETGSDTLGCGSFPLYKQDSNACRLWLSLI